MLSDTLDSWKQTVPEPITDEEVYMDQPPSANHPSAQNSLALVLVACLWCFVNTCSIYTYIVYHKLHSISHIVYVHIFMYCSAAGVHKEKLLLLLHTRLRELSDNRQAWSLKYALLRLDRVSALWCDSSRHDNSSLRGSSTIRKP